MRKQKLFRTMLRILGVSIMGLGFLISNIPMEESSAANVLINELPDTGGPLEAILDEGDGELILGGLVLSIKNTPDKYPDDPSNPGVPTRRYEGASEDPDTFGPLWQSRLKSITLSPSMTRVDRYTISDKIDDPNVYEEFDNVRNVIITIPSNIIDIEKNAIMCFGENRKFTIRSYPTQLTGLTVNPDITSPSVAKRYVDEYNAARKAAGKSQNLEFDPIPTTIQYKTQDNPLNVDITKVSAKFVRAGYAVDGPLDLHVNTKASDLAQIEGIPAVPTDAKRLYYDITLKDNIFNSTVTKSDFPFDTAEITIPVPASIDLTKYKIDKIYTVDGENKLEQITDFTPDISARTFTFKTTHLSTYAFEYSLITSRPSALSLAGASMVVSKDGDYTYSIVQKEASNIPDSAGVPAIIKDGKRMYYEISLLDSEKKNVTGFGTATVKIPLPSDITLDKFKLNQVYTIGTNGLYEKINNAIISTDTTVSPIVNYVNFSTSHFSEYVVEFAAIGAETNPDNNNNQNNNPPDNNNQNNNNPDNNNQNNNNNNQDNTGGDNNQNNNNQNNNNQNNNANTGNNNNNNTGNNANTGNQNNTGNTTNNNTNTNTGGNRVDMPPTADMTSVRSIAVIMMFLLGGVMILLSVGPLKPKRIR